MRLIGLAVVLALSLTSVPLVGEAQPTGIPRIGYLGNGKSTAVSVQAEAFRRGLRELGWIEGHTVTIDYRWAEENPDRLPALIGELVQLKVDVIALAGIAAIRAAKEAKSRFPSYSYPWPTR
jgi:putative tryptophan/tyrosine transport system substrate-binding protein